MPLLICEGPCNPSISAIDAAVFRVRAAAKDGKPPFGDDPLWDWQKTLQYTPHVSTGTEHFYRCAVCLTERRFGSSKWRA